MNVRIPLSNPTVGEAERRHLLAAMDSGWIAPAGPQLDAFEATVATRTGRRRAVGVSSGSAALHLALLVAGVRPGDVVLCPTLTFIASASAIVHAGATPFFVDADASGNMDPELAASALTRARVQGHRVGAVLGVDVYGKIADHAALSALAERSGVPYVVDAAESLGAVLDGAQGGSHGLLAAVSFNGNKIATASSGGAVLTDSDELADRARHLATQAREPGAAYAHREIGFNYRLSNLLAAVGLAQLEQLDHFLSVRRAHRDAYRALCDDVPGLSILGGEDAGDNCWLTSVLVDPQLTHTTPTALRQALAAEGIEARPVFAPMHVQPVFADEQEYPRLLTGVADELYATGLSLPSSPASSSEDVAEVCARLSSLVSTGVAA